MDTYYALYSKESLSRAVVSGGAEGCYFSTPGMGKSTNPIPTSNQEGANYAHHIMASIPGFKKPNDIAVKRSHISAFASEQRNISVYNVYCLLMSSETLKASVFIQPLKETLFSKYTDENYLAYL